MGSWPRAPSPPCVCLCAAYSLNLCFSFETLLITGNFPIERRAYGLRSNLCNWRGPCLGKLLNQTLIAC